MVKRRLVRIGVTFNRTFYFVDRGAQRGIAYDYARLVEERLNARFNPQKKNDQKIWISCRSRGGRTTRLSQRRRALFRRRLRLNGV